MALITVAAGGEHSGVAAEMAEILYSSQPDGLHRTAKASPIG